MLSVYATGGGLTSIKGGEDLPENVIWIDLHQPTEAEEAVVEKLLGVDVPTIEEMAEIEVSSRLYEEGGIYYMTLLVMVGADTPTPETSPITFILTRDRLITVRYSDPTAFRTFGRQCARPGVTYGSAESVFVSLLDVIVDRTADIMERIGPDMDKLSDTVFASSETKSSTSDFAEVMRGIGRNGDLNSMLRECLVSTGRITNFLSGAGPVRDHPDLHDQMETIGADVRSLTDHSTFLAGKIAFLLDATLGFISIQQNGIIKIVSVASVVLMPPTLIASIYGMNFKHMPELDWALGYPMALGMMVAAAVVPLLFFKSKGWL